MRKNLLFLLMALVLGAVTANAYNVRWMVDNPANIRVVTLGGNGQELSLESGVTVVEDSDNPLLVEAVDGATITSLELNETPVSPSGDGRYRIGITQNSMISVTTTGGGGAVTVKPTFFIMGDDQSAIITYGDGQKATSGVAVEVEKDTEFLISAAPAYKLTNVDSYRMGPVTDNGDGTYTYTATVDNAFVYVYTEGTGVKFSINVDYAPNVLAMTGHSTSASDPAMSSLNLYTGNNTVNVPAEEEFLQFYPAEGAEILSVTCNGNPVNYSGYVGWRAAFAAGDEFVVTTRGQEVNAKFVAPSGDAPLESYTFSVGTTVLELSGQEASATLHLGDVVSVTPKGANTLSYIYGANGATTKSDNQVQVTADNCEIWVSGKAATGVNINVSDAAQIVILQSNGYGQPLALTTGMNKFALDAIGNPLKVSAAEGCEILSVSLNEKPVAVDANGSYLVSATEGCYIDIKSREIPADVMLSVMMDPSAPGLYEGVEITVDGQQKTLDGDMAMLTVPFESTVTVKAKFGYVLSNVSSQNLYITEEEGVYTFVADQNASVMVYGNKIEAGEGQALVTVKADNPLMVKFYEYSGEEFKQTLTTENVNVVTVGNILTVRIFSSSYFLKKVTVNGHEVSLEKDPRMVEIEIQGDMDVEVETGAYVDVATYDVSDPVNHSIIGKLYVKVGDELKKNHGAVVGETLTFVSEVAAGYQLDYVKRIVPESDVEYGETYTVTAEDAEAGMLIFEGVYSKSTDTPSYVVRCNDTTISDPEAPIVGYPRIKVGDQYYREYRFLEGDAVDLWVATRDDYEFVRFMLFYHNEVTISNPYIVNGEDANSEGVIDIQAEFRVKGSGVADVVANGSLSYDKALQQLSAGGAISVYNASGSRVLYSQEGELSVAGLEGGLYIAVSGNDVLKFVK